MWAIYRIYLAQLLVVVFGSMQLNAAAIPADRNGDWRAGATVGIPGGIPRDRVTVIDVTQAPYNADKTGGRDASTSINNAIRGATAGSIVYLPAGVFRIDAQISLRNKSNITLRGSGPSTVLDIRYSSGAAIYAGSDTQWPDNYNNGGSNITAGYSQRAASLTVSDADLFSVGDILIITENNDLELPVLNVNGGSRLRGQMSRIVSKAGLNIGIAPSLFWALSASNNPKVHKLLAKISNVGIENLKIDLSNSTAPFGIWLQQADRCWIDNVVVSRPSGYGIYLLYAFESEVRRATVLDRKTAGSNGAGILVERTTACLVEDNILIKQFPHIEVNFMSTGNVFAYNFCEDSSVYGVVGCSIDTNHGPHNSYNLYEGNVAPNVQADGYFGSVSDDTVFRNWLHGTCPGIQAAREPVLLQRFTRNYSIVGNLLGKSGVAFASIGGAAAGGPYSFGLPNMGNTGYSGIAQLSRNTPWGNWQALLNGTIPQIPFNNRFQEKDLDVADTVFVKGNFNLKDNAVSPAESLSGAILPSSLYRQSKPSWFGELQWPAFGPDSISPRIDSIPAGYRYLHNKEVPGASSNSLPDAPSGLIAK